MRAASLIAPLALIACATQQADGPPARSGPPRDLGIILDAGPDRALVDAGDLDAQAADPDRGMIDLGPVDQGQRRDVEVIVPLDAAPPDPCAHAIDLNAELAAGGAYDGDLQGRASETLGTCGGAAGGELLFRYVPGAAEPLVFATDYPETDAPTVLYLRADCEDAADLACVRGSDAVPGAQLAYTPASPEPLYLVVDTGSREGGGRFRLAVGPPAGPACDDGRDNDGDGLIDLMDPGCLDPAGVSEADPAIPPLCADGIDNDEDGVIDFPADDDCPAAGADDERRPCRLDLPCDGRNMGRNFNDGLTVGALWQAFRWRAPRSADVTRLEIFTGERDGPSTLSLYSSVDDMPGERLSGADFVLQNAVGWQGVDLPMPVIVSVDTVYWVVWQTIDGAQAPFEQGGERVEYRGSFDEGESWGEVFENGVKYRIFCCDR